MLKELLLTGILSSAAYSQVQLGHNPKIETKGSNSNYWYYKDLLTDSVIAPRKIMQFTSQEDSEISSILEEIPLTKKYAEINYPVYISKGVMSWEIGETLMDDSSRFSEIMLDHRMLGCNAEEFLEIRDIDVSSKNFHKYVLIHELVHAYYNYEYKYPKKISSAIIPHPHYVAIAVECIDIIKDGNMDTYLYERRLKQLSKYLCTEDFEIVKDTPKAEINKIRDEMEDWMESEDYKFLFE